MLFPILPLEQTNQADNENLITAWIPQGITFYNFLKQTISQESVQSFLINSPRYKSELKSTIKSKLKSPNHAQIKLDHNWSESITGYHNISGQPTNGWY